MITAYYSKGCDSREMFADLKIASVPGFENRMNKYNVIKFDLNGEYASAENKDNVLKNLHRKIKREMMREFKELDLSSEDSLADMMLEVYAETGGTFIILIDEYDVLVREEVSDKLFSEYLTLLNGIFKNDTLRPALSLAYITGILPVIRDRVQSKLNNFKEYTILDAKELAGFVGFTSEEVMDLCEQYHVDFDECRLWYDGYRQHGIEIYNPESVVESMLCGYFGNYWGENFHLYGCFRPDQREF